MENARLYASANKLQIAIQINVLREFGSLIKWDKLQRINLLDVGCGDGDALMQVFVPKIPERWESVLGIDILLDMVRIAREKYDSLENVTFELFDIASKNSDEIATLGLFTHVTSFLCLHWIKERGQAFRNIYNLLQPEGQLFATIIWKSNLGGIYQELASDPRWQPYMNDWMDYAWQQTNISDVHLREHVEDAGFTRYQVELFNYVYHFETEQEMEESLQAINAFVTRMPLSLRNAYMSNLLEVYRRQTGMHQAIENNIFVLYASK